MSTETSDKNVAKAKILIEEFNTYNDLDGIQDLKQYIIAIQNLLSEREKDKKKIQELEEENRIFALEGSKVRVSLYIKENYIPIQKIQDKIEELNNQEKELQNSITEEEREEYEDANISFLLCDIEIRREVLKELLQEGNK